MINARKAEVGQLSAILIPIVVIALLGVSFGIISGGIGDNYNQVYDNEFYNELQNNTDRINDLSRGLSDSVINSNTTNTNVLTSSERLFSGAYNSILLLGAIPELYISMISAVAKVLNIPLEITALIISAIIFTIIGTVIYLILGRR